MAMSSKTKEYCASLQDYGGWAVYASLLKLLFALMKPHLQSSMMFKSLKLLYNGSTRVLLMLLHDYPSFLAHHAALIQNSAGLRS